MISDKNTSANILKTYKLEKLLTGIEMYRVNYDKAMYFIKELRRFFFISKKMTNFEYDEQKPGYDCEFFISRFQTLVGIPVRYEGLKDRYADLAGVLYGYNLKEVIKYCLDERLKE